MFILNMKVNKKSKSSLGFTFRAIIGLLLTLFISAAGSIANCVLSNSGVILMADMTNRPYESCSSCGAGYFIYQSETINGATESVFIYTCSPCASNCLTCFQISTKCSSCPTGSYLNLMTNICTACSNINVFCIQCNNMAACSLCLGASLPDTNGNCNVNCVNIYGAHCQSCDAQNCLICSPFFALDSSTPKKCVACSSISNCNDCVNGPVCTSCLTGFYHTISSLTKECVLCEVNCAVCIDGPECTQCKPKYVLDSTGPGNGCFLCPSGTYASHPDQCSLCPGNCDWCNDVGNGVQCSICYYPFELDSNKICVISCQLAYGVLCSTCDTSACLSCVSNSIMDQSTGTLLCQPCGIIPNCLNCIGGPLCTVCEPNYIMNFQTPTHECATCAILSNCNTCIDGPECTLCDSGYIIEYLVGTTNCVPCASGYYPVNVKQCSPCLVTNCHTCVDSGTGPQCTACVSPYTLDAANLCFIDCVANYDLNCATCDDLNCLSCVAGSALNAINGCSPCSNIANCQECADGPICTLCVSPYVYDLTTPTKECVDCSSITDCLSCIDGPQCTQCPANFVLSDHNPWNLCEICPTGNYVASPIQCLQCPTGCSSCFLSSGTVQCQSCSPPNTLNTNQCVKDCAGFYGINCLDCDGTRCLSCSAGFAFPAGSTTCTDCRTITDCINCIDGLICTQCIADRYLDFASPNKSCVVCSVHINNCISCLDGPICLQCTTNYVLTAQSLGNDCVPCLTGTYPTSLLVCSFCPDGCSSCSNLPGGVQCQGCNPPYGLNSSNLCALDCPALHGSTCQACDVSNCLRCISGYNFPDASTTCTACSTLSSCLTCRAGIFCTSCASPFVVDISTLNGTCVACPFPNCAACKNGPECTNCAINYVFDGIGPFQNCVPCPSGSYASSTIKCSPCPRECASCSYSVNGITCSSCTSIAIHNTTTQQCMRCDLLLDYCSECSSATTCNSCQFPYKKGLTSLCDQCQTGFLYSNGYCTKELGCQTYLINESRCVACLIPQNFQYDSNKSTCKCKTGYYMNNASVCQSKCGDKILATPDQACDDGNLINGDGCTASCQQESEFVCLPVSPAQCILQFAPSGFEYNYAYRQEGENKGKFSLSLTPFHSGYKYVNWAKYVSFNISEDFIVTASLIYIYLEETSELLINFEYKDTLEELVVQFKLTIHSEGLELVKSKSRLLSMINHQKTTISKYTQDKIYGTKNQRNSASKTTRLLQSQRELSIIIKLGGINQRLIFEQSAILQIYKGATIGSYIITVLIFIQFIIASYTHKMIGLQTIHILQFFFFVRTILQQHLSNFLSPMNVFKHAAYGGYSNYEFFYGNNAEQLKMLTYTTVEDNFVSIQLLKYFTFNTNLPLLMPTLAFFGFMVAMVRKNNKRREYFKSYVQLVKDKYTKLNRSFKWVYDHFVFPYTNLFNMLVVFSTVILLSAHSKSTSNFKISNTSLLDVVEFSSFGTQLTVTFITFSIFCFEVFESYEEFRRSQLTQAQKARVPKSNYEKLEHDENNPDRPNYKPGYIMFYMMYYLLVELVLMLDILFEPLQDWGVQIMAICNFAYLIFIWNWSPYNEAVYFHNKALRFNHFTVFFFMAFTVLFKRIQLPLIGYPIFICLILLMLLVVSILGFIRIVFEMKFRKKLEEDPFLMGDRKKRQQIQIIEDEAINKKQALLLHNNYTFQNQARAWFKQKKNLDIEQLTNQQIERVKAEFNKELYEYQKMKARNDGITDLLCDNFQIQRGIHKQENKKDKFEKQSTKKTGHGISALNKTRNEVIGSRNENGQSKQVTAKQLRSTIKQQLQGAKIDQFKKRLK